MSNPVFLRDRAAEDALLSELQNLNCALLQQDWDKQEHGDLDIVLDRKDWLRFLKIIRQFSERNSFPIVKAYEIEYGLVCLVMLTQHGAIFLDVAIAGARVESFGVDLVHALANRQLLRGVFVVDKSDEHCYASGKLAVKRSRVRRVIKKIRNLPVIVNRIWSCTLVCRGCFLYIPYLTQTDMLRVSTVIQKTTAYLESRLTHRYAPLENDISADAD